MHRVHPLLVIQFVCCWTVNTHLSAPCTKADCYANDLIHNSSLSLPRRIDEAKWNWQYHEPAQKISVRKQWLVGCVRCEIYINFVERDERFCCCLSLCRFCLFRHILHIYLCNFNSFVGEKCETCHSHSFVDLTTSTLTSYPYFVGSICRMHFSNATSTAVKPSKYDFTENIMALCNALP